MRKWYLISPLILQKLIWVPTRLILIVFGGLEVKGLDNLKGIKSNAIFAPNHVSELDPILIPAALPFWSRFSPMFYVSSPMKEFDESQYRWKRHFYSSDLFHHVLGGYEVIRGLRDYNKALAPHLTLLARGNNICIFPESGITRDGTLKVFHGGVIHLAHASGAPIIPVAISGVYQMTARLFFSRKRHITVEFGAPITVSAPTVMNDDVYRSEAVRIAESTASMLKNHQVAGGLLR